MSSNNIRLNKFELYGPKNVTNLSYATQKMCQSAAGQRHYPNCQHAWLAMDQPNKDVGITF